MILSQDLLGFFRQNYSVKMERHLGRNLRLLLADHGLPVVTGDIVELDSIPAKR